MSQNREETSPKNMSRESNNSSRNSSVSNSKSNRSRNHDDRSSSGSRHKDRRGDNQGYRRPGGFDRGPRRDYDNNRNRSGGYMNNNSNYNNGGNNNQGYNRNQGRGGQDRYDQGSRFSNNYNNFSSSGGNQTYYDKNNGFKHLTMRRYRDDNESHIRVHFIIRNCYVRRGQAEEFIFEAKDQIQKCGQIDVLQMFNHKDENTDIAIGMRYDQDAQKIMDGIRIIKLFDRNRKLLNQTPEITPIFKKFLLEQETGYKKRGSSTERKKKKNRSTSSSRSRSRSRSQLKKPLKEKPKVLPTPTCYEKRILFFGIPQEFSEHDMKKALVNKGVEVVSMEWDKYETMEYLAVKLKNQTHYETIVNGVINLDYQETKYNPPINIKIPVLILQEDTTQKILDQLHNFQVRLEYKNKISSITIYNLFKKYGTIVNLLQDEDSLQIIYSQPHHKLNQLTIPHTLNFVQPEPYEEYSIEISKVKSTELIDRQELIRTIHYQIQIMQSHQIRQQGQEQPQQNQSQIEQEQPQQQPQQHQERYDQQQQGKRSPSQRQSSSSSKSRSKSKNRSRSNSSHRKTVFKKQDGKFTKASSSRSPDGRRDDRPMRRGSSDWNNNNRGGYNNNYNNNRGGNNYNRGGGFNDRRDNNRQGGNQGYGKNFNSYNEKNYNHNYSQNYNNNNDRGGGRFHNNFNNNNNHMGGGYDRNRNNYNNHNNNNNNRGYQKRY